MADRFGLTRKGELICTWVCAWSDVRVHGGMPRGGILGVQCRTTYSQLSTL